MCRQWILGMTMTIFVSAVTIPLRTNYFFYRLYHYLSVINLSYCATGSNSFLFFQFSSILVPYNHRIPYRWRKISEMVDTNF